MILRFLAWIAESTAVIYHLQKWGRLEDRKLSCLETFKFETNVRFPIGEIKYISTHEVRRWEEWFHYRYTLIIQLIPIIWGFHIGDFAYSLKFISNPKINTWGTFLITCRALKKSESPYRHVLRECSDFLF